MKRLCAAIVLSLLLLGSAVACSGGGANPTAPTPAETLGPPTTLADALIDARDLDKVFSDGGTAKCLSPSDVSRAGHGLVRSCGKEARATSGSVASVRSQAYAYDSPAAAAAFIDAFNGALLRSSYASALRGFTPGSILGAQDLTLGDVSKAYLMQVSGSAPGKTDNAVAYVVVYQSGRYTGQITYETFQQASASTAEMKRLGELMITRMGQLPDAVLTPEAN